MSVQASPAEGEFAKAIEVDQHGIEPIPDADRDSTAWQQFWIWFGANVTPTSWVVGTVGPLLGLSVIQSIIVFAVGQAAGALIFGTFTIMGRRTGVNQLTLSRSAFGIRGNHPIALIQGLITLSWIGLNTYVVLDLATYVLHRLGAPDNTATEYSVAAFIMVVQVLIGTFGFYTIRTFEKWTMPVLATIMAIMTVLAFAKGHILWNHSTVHGSALVTSITELMTAVGIGWGFSWIAWASDYSRFTKRDVSDRRVFWASAIGTFIPLIWLAILGAAMSSTPSGKDPAILVASLFGAMTIPVLLVIIHGAVAVNVESVYSAPLCLLAGGLRMRRWMGSLISAVIASGVLIGFLASSSFATSFTNYMDSFVIWTAAWGAVVFTDFFLTRRSQIAIAELYAPSARSVYGAVSYRGLISFGAALVAGWTWEYGLVPAFQGPFARVTHGIDLSWLAAGVVGGGLYYVLGRSKQRRVALGVPVQSASPSGGVAP
jgi:nucleobase:cation symporter-1, NCS1 family